MDDCCLISFNLYEGIPSGLQDNKKMAKGKRQGAFQGRVRVCFLPQITLIRAQITQRNLSAEANA